MVEDEDPLFRDGKETRVKRGGAGAALVDRGDKKKAFNKKGYGTPPGKKPSDLDTIINTADTKTSSAEIDCGQNNIDTAESSPVEKIHSPESSPQKKVRDRAIVWFATQTGTAEGFAEEIAGDLKRFCRARGKTAGGKTIAPPGKNAIADLLPAGVEVRDIETLDPETFLAKEMSSAFHVLIGSTYGEGDPPDSAEEFFRWLTSESESEKSSSWKELKFALFGCGNRQYEQFNGFITKVENLLERLGASKCCATGLGDDNCDLEADFETWRAGQFREEFLEKAVALEGIPAQEVVGDSFSAQEVGGSAGRQENCGSASGVAPDSTATSREDIVNSSSGTTISGAPAVEVLPVALPATGKKMTSSITGPSAAENLAAEKHPEVLDDARRSAGHQALTCVFVTETIEEDQCGSREESQAIESQAGRSTGQKFLKETSSSASREKRSFLFKDANELVSTPLQKLLVKNRAEDPNSTFSEKTNSTSGPQLLSKFEELVNVSQSTKVSALFASFRAMQTPEPDARVHDAVHLAFGAEGLRWELEQALKDDTGEILWKNFLRCSQEGPASSSGGVITLFGGRPAVEPGLTSDEEEEGSSNSKEGAGSSSSKGSVAGKDGATSSTKLPVSPPLGFSLAPTNYSSDDASINNLPLLSEIQSAKKTSSSKNLFEQKNNCPVLRVNEVGADKLAEPFFAMRRLPVREVAELRGRLEFSSRHLVSETENLVSPHEEEEEVSPRPAAVSKKKKKETFPKKNFPKMKETVLSKSTFDLSLDLASELQNESLAESKRLAARGTEGSGAGSSNENFFSCVTSSACIPRHFAGARKAAQTFRAAYKTAANLELFPRNCDAVVEAWWALLGGLDKNLFFDTARVYWKADTGRVADALLKRHRELEKVSAARGEKSKEEKNGSLEENSNEDDYTTASLAVKVPFPSAGTLREVFAQFLDLTTLPSRAVFRKFLAYVPDEEKRNELSNYLLSDESRWKTLQKSRCSFLEAWLLFLLPAGISLGLGDFLQICPRQKRREYTISSSVLASPTTVSTVVGLLHENVAEDLNFWKAEEGASGGKTANDGVIEGVIEGGSLLTFWGERELAFLRASKSLAPLLVADSKKNPQRWYHGVTTTWLAALLHGGDSGWSPGEHNSGPTSTSGDDKNISAAGAESIFKKSSDTNGENKVETWLGDPLGLEVRQKIFHISPKQVNSTVKLNVPENDEVNNSPVKLINVPQLYATISKSSFSDQLPAPASRTPVLLVAAGTGIAPFIGFLRDELAMQSRRRILLVFGCRSRSEDFLFREFLEDGGFRGLILDSSSSSPSKSSKKSCRELPNFELAMAFSREQGEKKVYVQDKIREIGADVAHLLDAEGSMYYNSNTSSQTALISSLCGG